MDDHHRNRHLSRRRFSSSRPLDTAGRIHSTDLRSRF